MRRKLPSQIFMSDRRRGDHNEVRSGDGIVHISRHQLGARERSPPPLDDLYAAALDKWLECRLGTRVKADLVSPQGEVCSSSAAAVTRAEYGNRLNPHDC